MNLPCQHRAWLAISLALGLLGGQSARAQPGTAQRAAASAAVQKSPVAFFRELLAMNPAERQRALTNRSAEKQKAILDKVAEYEALPVAERELRLRATELRWYLVPLLSVPLTNRVAALGHLPDDMRKLVEDRLEQWQLLPPPLQEQILTNDQKLELYLQLTGISMSPEPDSAVPYPPGYLEQLKAQLRLVEPYFELTPEEKARVLETLPEVERREMEATLRAFEQLPSAQRTQCIRAFGKFSGMTPEARRQFLKNAQRWQVMTPEERQQWRNLVRDVPEWPPLPPGLDAAAVEEPSKKAVRAVFHVVTNRDSNRQALAPANR